MIAQRFHFDISAQLIIHKARGMKFTSFNEIVRVYGIADQDWAFVYTLLFQHLNQMIYFCYEANLPCFPTLVIAKKNRGTGNMAKRQLMRLSHNMLRAGYTGVLTMENMYQHQKACFEWAKTHTQNLHEFKFEKGRVLPEYAPSPPMGRQIYKVK